MSSYLGVERIRYYLSKKSTYSRFDEPDICQDLILGITPLEIQILNHFRQDRIRHTNIVEMWDC